ncbi:MAG TPA: hypothetical protein VFT47_06310 [Vicinamibacterales bacterium]|nr:hypothetical protein [Vicinamibacterales bacterium]
MIVEDRWRSGLAADHGPAQMRDVEHDAVGRMKAHVLHLDLDVSGGCRQGQAGSAQQSHRTDEAHTMPQHGTDFGRNGRAGLYDALGARGSRPGLGVGVRRGKQPFDLPGSV